MDFNEYQKKAFETAMSFSRETLFYNALGLAGETGEVLELVKKFYRDEMDSASLMFELGDELFPSKERIEKLKKELGDVLWYLSALASSIDLRLEDIAKANIEKLASRAERGVLGGDGDER